MKCMARNLVDIENIHHHADFYSYLFERLCFSILWNISIDWYWWTSTCESSELYQLIDFAIPLIIQVVFNKWRQNGVDGDMSKLPTIFWWSDIFNKYIVSVFPQLSVFDAYDNSLHLVWLYLPFHKNKITNWLNI